MQADTTGTLFLPPQSSTISGEVDALFNFVLYSSVVFFLIVVLGAAYFVFRYRRKARLELSTGPSHNTKLEILWTVIPTILVIIVFAWGFKTFLKMNVVPGDAMEIKVTGQKWFWTFDYIDSGVNTLNELVVPVDKPIQLTMSSQDVIHSFFVPNFRVKMDVLPNRYSVTWFEATQKGKFDLFCAEYCGTGHSEMIGKVTVLGEREYNEWLESSSTVGEGLTLPEFGAKLYVSKACITCHSIDGNPLAGPSFKGRYNTQQPMSDGTDALVDENYIRESILNPMAKLSLGFQPVMPSYQGLLKDKEIDGLIEYIKSLNN
jgi:cytochrome c oxidase subunit II